VVVESVEAAAQPQAPPLQARPGQQSVFAEQLCPEIPHTNRHPPSSQAKFGTPCEQPHAPTSATRTSHNPPGSRLKVASKGGASWQATSK